MARLFGRAEEITGLSNGKYCGFKILVGLEESKITWYSNLKNRAVAIDKLRKEVELRGSQTYTQAKDIDRLTWKKIELQGSQTVHFNLRLV